MRSRSRAAAMPPATGPTGKEAEASAESPAPPPPWPALADVSRPVGARVGGEVGTEVGLTVGVTTALHLLELPLPKPLLTVCQGLFWREQVVIPLAQCEQALAEVAVRRLFSM